MLKYLRAFNTVTGLYDAVPRAVLVIEAPMKSGSLITAARALEEGRDVFAVPGRIDDPIFRGSNARLRDGAVIASSPTTSSSPSTPRCPPKRR